MSLSDGDRLRRRRWSFATVTFDEVSWSLIVDGRRVPVEQKPLELLRELLVHAGSVVTKDDLLDRIWPSVTVAEGSLSTAIYKLRLALRDDGRNRRIIETVPSMGYRLLVPIEVEEVTGSAAPGAAEGSLISSPLNGYEPAGAPRGRRSMISRSRGMAAIAAGAVIAAAATDLALTRSEDVFPHRASQPYSQMDAQNAIRRLDVRMIERMLAAGWNPNLPIRGEGNAALHYAVEMCEWDPRHDQARLLLVVRTLYEGGGRLDLRNLWGDTPYSIAKSPRFCGPDHPVTRSMAATCSGSSHVVPDRCLASYEVARRDRQRPWGPGP